MRMHALTPQCMKFLAMLSGVKCSFTTIMLTGKFGIRAPHDSYKLQAKIEREEH